MSSSCSSSRFPVVQTDRQTVRQKYTLGMRGINKCPTIIYRLKKYRDTGIGISWYFVTSSIVDNFCNSAVLSQILFAMYINDIICLCKLSAPERGCNVAGTHVGVFSERELMFTFAICCRPSVCL